MKTKYLALCGLMAALTAICAWIAIPIFGTVITLQTFAICLALLTLGGKWGCVTICVYLALGAVGLPVFSGFQGGIGTLMGPTGGYLWGFLLGGLVYWGITGKDLHRRKFLALSLFLLSCYSCGFLWYYVNFARGSIPFTLAHSILPCLLPDVCKIALAWQISRKLPKK